MPIVCSHADQVRVTSTDANVCEECLKNGDRWVQLRLCLTCGHVGCCDSSKNKHARAHFHESHHPLIRPAQETEEWVWCYLDDDYVGDITGHTRRVA